MEKMGARNTLGFTVLGLFCLTATAGDHTVKCTGKKNKTELTVPDAKGKIAFILNGTSVDAPKEAWIFAMNRRGDAIVTEELTLMVDGTGANSPKKEFRFENLGTCPDGEAVRVRHFEVTATTKVFLEEASCTCKTK